MTKLDVLLAGDRKDVLQSRRRDAVPSVIANPPQSIALKGSVIVYESNAAVLNNRKDTLVADGGAREMIGR